MTHPIETPRNCLIELIVDNGDLPARELLRVFGVIATHSRLINASDTTPRTFSCDCDCSLRGDDPHSSDGLRIDNAQNCVSELAWAAPEISGLLALTADEGASHALGIG